MARKEIPKDETKAEKFVRVANPRLKNAIKYMRLVKSAVGSNAYDVNAEQVTTILETLSNEVESIRLSYEGKTRTKEVIEDVL